MKIDKISYCTSSYMTTNPPREENHSLDLIASGGFGAPMTAFLMKRDSVNGSETSENISVPYEKFLELVSLIESGNILNSMFEEMFREMPPQMPLVGGTTKAVFSVMANGVELSTDKISDGIYAVITKLQALAVSGGGTSFNY